MKWTSWLICFVLIFLGGFCGIDLYRKVTAESYIRGSINIENRFTMESFNYCSTSVIFYHDIYDGTTNYTFEIDLKPVEDFNGQKNKYQVVLNGYIMTDAIINAGSVFTQLYMDFYDISGNIVCNSKLDISIKFFSNKTTLTMVTAGHINAGYLEQYFDDNGIRLFVNELKGI